MLIKKTSIQKNKIPMTLICRNHEKIVYRAATAQQTACLPITHQRPLPTFKCNKRICGAHKPVQKCGRRFFLNA